MLKNSFVILIIIAINIESIIIESTTMNNIRR